jgi:hypothetical protein
MENKLKEFRLFKIKLLAEMVKMPYAKLRDSLMGKYYSLTEQDETKVYNKMREEFERASLALGFTFEGKRVKKL